MELIFNPSTLPNINRSDRWSREDLIEDMKTAAALVLKGEDIEAENLEISLSFVGEEEIRALNRTYRNRDAVTDVLSFPQYENPADLPAGVNVSLGDVVLCVDRAKVQAEEYGHCLRRELVYLFTHSLFHLLGYDHEESADKEAMRRREEETMSALGLERECEKDSEKCGEKDSEKTIKIAKRQ